MDMPRFMAMSTRVPDPLLVRAEPMAVVARGADTGRCEALSSAKGVSFFLGLAQRCVALRCFFHRRNLGRRCAAMGGYAGRSLRDSA